MPRAWLPWFILACGLVGEGCSSDVAGTRDPTRSSTSAIVGGRASGVEESFVGYLESGLPGNMLRCSATLLAPNVALTARHCVLAKKNDQLSCTADGQLTDPTDPRGQDVTLEDVANVHLFFGSNHSSFVSSPATAIFVPNEIGLCRNDLALVVLEKPLGDAHVPVRLTPVRLGEKITVAGWGYTGDGQAPVLPEARSGLDDVRVGEVGPGLIPAATFAIPGNTMCFGDSGAGARIAGAVAGVYSRIEGGSCTLAEGRNVFMMTAPHRALIDAAFARAGAKAWYEGEPPPWLAATGAPCTADAACQLGRCDVVRGVCATPCGDAGSACGPNETCDTRGLCAAVVPVPPGGPPEPAPPSSSCAFVPARVGGGPALALMIALFLVVVRVRARS